MKVSIIICTSNRAEYLRHTLAALAQIHVSSDLPAEVIVVDNASTDSTSELVQSCRLLNLPVHYVHEPCRGKGYAYNSGMIAARGDVLLFTDDDVRPPTDWIAGMCAPILSGTADAVAGGVKIAPHLERSWMQPVHRAYLASTQDMNAAEPSNMIGANMAFSRRTLARVPAFDPELGPGALGFCDELLFSWQLKEAGFRLASAFDIVVEHHFDASRLLRASLMDRARKEGRSLAYITHHWHHHQIKLPRKYLIKRSLRLACLRHKYRSRRGVAKEGLPEWEMRLLIDIAFYQQYLLERRRPRNYALRGLVKCAL